MKIAVFGATGRTGRLLTSGALERGHVVTALVRDPARLGALSERVHVVTGDVLDGGAVSDAVDGQEAVLVALGVAVRKGDPAVSSLGTLNVIRSMQRYGTRRLVVLSSGGAQPGRDPNASWYFDHLVKPLFLKHAFADLRRMETSVRQSELDWTLVRAARLVDGPARGTCRAEPGYSLPGGARIARADVAAFMLDELQRRDNIAHALAIAY